MVLYRNHCPSKSNRLLQGLSLAKREQELPCLCAIHTHRLYLQLGKGLQQQLAKAEKSKSSGSP